MESNKKKMSALDFFVIGFGAMVGVGWAVSLSNWFRLAGGPVPAGICYLIILLLLVPVALSYAELVPMLPVAGGGMAFSYKSFGEKVGFISGWAAYGGFVSLMPWEAIQITDVLSYLIPGVKSGKPLYTVAGSDVYLTTIIIGCVVAVLLFMLNMRGMAAAANLQKFLCIVLVGSGVVGAIAAVIGGDASNILPIYDTSNPAIYGTDPGLTNVAHHSMFGGIISFLPFAVFFLCGFETIPQGIEDAGGDVKGVGRSVLISVVLACVFYFVICITFGFGMPWQEYALPEVSGGVISNPSAASLFLQVFDGPAGTAIFWLITIGAMAGLLTSWNGFFRPSANLMMGMARGRLLPGKLAEQNKDGIPVPALIVSLVLSIIGPFVGVGLINNLTVFSGAAYVISWTLTAYSQAKLRKSMPDANRPYKAPGGAIVGLVGGIMMTILLVLMFIPGNPCYIGTFAILMLFVWMGIGVVLYLIAGKERRTLTQEQREALLFEHAADHAGE